MKHSERSQAHLARSLQMLAEIEGASQTASRVESAVMSRWDVEHDPRRPARRGTRRVAGMATTVAAGVTIFGVLAWQRSGNELSTAVAPTGAAVSGYTTVAVVGGPLMAGEAIRVVRMRVARSTLGELGIPSTARSGATLVETVDIDVLVGEDGVARGVRVPISEL